MQHCVADLNYGAMHNEVIGGLGAQISECPCYAAASLLSIDWRHESPALFLEL